MLIYLLGFPGSGKSTTGKRLAKALGMEFADLDEIIAETSGMSIPEIFATAGEVAFRKRETEALRKCTKLDHTVIATGGGTPCFNDNMTLMNRNGITVYIRLSPGGLFRRLKHATAERPLLKDKTEAELKDYIEKTLSEREKFYKKAQYTVKGEDLDIRSLASWIRERSAKFN